MEFTKYGFHRRPFRPTPAVELYCPCDGHEAVLASVQRAYSTGHGVALIDGPTGIGKTTVAHRFLQSLAADTRKVLLHASPGLKPADFFQAVLFDLGLPYQGLSEQELRLAVHGELLSALAAGQSVVILMDEAHHTTPAVLEEIRLFGNLQSPHDATVFVLLVGLPAIRDAIDRTAGSGFEERLGVRCRLEPLSRDEAVRYIRHQVRECGGRPDWVLSDEALERIAEHGQGVPRRLNRIAGLAFELAAAAGEEAVDAEAVHEAAIQLGLNPSESESRDHPPAAESAGPHRIPAEDGEHPLPTIQLRRPPRTTQQGASKKVKRKSA